MARAVIIESTVGPGPDGHNPAGASARSGAWAAVLVALCAWLPFAATRHFDHVHDDHELRGPTSLAVDPRADLTDLWTADLFGTFAAPHGQSGYWRPLVLLSFRLEAVLSGVLEGGGSWTGYVWLGHVITLGCHVVACLALLALLRAVGFPDAAAAWAAALFAVHPVHAEVVAWTSGRTESLGVALVFGGAAAWIRGARAGTLAAFVGFLAALLCKESALVLVAFVSVLAACRGRRGAGLVGPPTAAALTALVLRAAAVGLERQLDPAVHLGPDDPSARWLTWLSLLPDLARSVVWPVPFSPVHAVQAATSWDAPGVLAGAALLVLLGVTSAFALGSRWRRHEGRIPALFVSVLPLLTLALLAPWTDIPLGLPEQAGPLADRYVYALAAGPCVLVARCLLPALRRAGRMAPVLLLVPLALLGPECARRAEAWRSDAHFARAGLAVYPGLPTLWNHLGVARLEDLRARGDEQAGAEAEAAFRRALVLQPEHPMAQLNLFITLATLGREDEAHALIPRLLRQSPEDPHVLDNVAEFHAMAGRWDEAIALYERQFATGRELPHARERWNEALAARSREQAARAER